MTTLRTRGFTLIELLVVIAIIGILAGFTLLGVGKMFERANITDCTNDFNQLRTAMTQYYTDNSSYPPAYGYLRWEVHNKYDPKNYRPGSTTLVPSDFWNRPYTVFIGQYGATELYDRFSEAGYDTNDDGVVEPSEFLPLGHTDRATGKVSFPSAIYSFHDSDYDFASMLEKMSKEERPYIYIPVNLDQFRLANRYFYENDFRYAEEWDPDNKYLKRLTFPPARYDAFVLISIGPSANTYGVATPPRPENLSDGQWAQLKPYQYHINALRIYFLATRDANDNNELDFDYMARMRGDEAGADGNQLPDPLLPNAPGPMIYVP